MAVLDLFLLLVPVTVIIVSLLNVLSILTFIGMGIALLYAALYGWYAHRVWNKGAIVGALLWPLLILQEIILVAVSSYKYRKHAITWKGRKVLIRR